MNSRSTRLYLLFFALLALLQGGACTGSALEKLELEIKTADGKTVFISTELALTAEQQQRGYMERENIPDYTGMVFVYKADRQMHFWMDNTPTPLSIAYIDSRGRIREIYDLQPYNRQTVSSTGSMRYALEVPQGWFSRTGISVGDSFSAASLKALSERAVF